MGLYRQYILVLLLKQYIRCVYVLCVCGGGVRFVPSELLKFRDRIPVGTRISVPFQTGPGVNPTYYTMGTEPFQGVNRPGRGVVHSPQPSAEVKERVELYIWGTAVAQWLRC